LAAWILAHGTLPGFDRLWPEAALVFALGPLVRSPMTTSAKFAVVALCLGANVRG
jgi:aldehyde:ferredoxin oxidoreductase